MQRFFFQLLFLGFCMSAFINCGSSGMVGIGNNGTSGPFVCNGQGCTVGGGPSPVGMPSATGAASVMPSTLSPPPIASASPVVPSPGASVAVNTSWPCQVDILQVGQVTVDSGGGGVSGMCGLGIANQLLNQSTCQVTPPGGTMTTGWCVPNVMPVTNVPSISPVPLPSSGTLAPVILPSFGPTPPLVMQCPATLEAGASILPVLACGSGSGPAGSMPCFITPVGGAVISGWCTTTG
jgi:hypothetical protein